MTLHLPDGLRTATSRVSPESTAGSLHAWARLRLLSAGGSIQRPYELHAVWSKGLAAVVLRDEQTLALSSAGMTGDAEVTLVWV